MTRTLAPVTPCSACATRPACSLKGVALCRRPAGLGALDLSGINWTYVLIAAAVAFVAWRLMRRGGENKTKRRRRLQLARLEYEKQRLS